MLLTQQQVEQLTGYTKPSFQIRWLRERAWPFEIGGDNRPKVLRSVAESKLGGRVSTEPEMVLPNEATENKNKPPSLHVPEARETLVRQARKVA